MGVKLLLTQCRYSFFNGPSPLVSNNTVAAILQDYLLSFAKTSKPSTTNTAVPAFPTYGSSGVVQELGAVIANIPDPAANARCLWWQKALYM